MKNLISIKNQSINQSINQSKKLFLTVVILAASFGTFAQISVNSSGLVTLCNNLQTAYNSGGEMLFYPIQTTTHLGIPGNQWWEIRGVNIYANGTYLGSDRRIKENFRGIDQPLEKILKLKGAKYDFIKQENDSLASEKLKEEKEKHRKNRLGFIAQEMMEVLPEAVIYDEDQDQFYIEYTAIIPVIVEAMKQQQTIIEELTARIEKLEGNTSKEKSATINDSSSDELKAASLDQNIPNPFTNNTTINMYLPNTVTKAVLYIYNMQGVQIRNITLQERGNVATIVEGGDLEAGMYLYTLLADGKEVDTKKMILTR